MQLYFNIPSTAHGHERIIQPYHKQMHTSNFLHMQTFSQVKFTKPTKHQLKTYIKLKHKVPSDLPLFKKRKKTKTKQKSLQGYDILVSLINSFTGTRLKEKYETKRRRKWTETSDMFTGCKHHLFLCIIHCTCHASVDPCHSFTGCKHHLFLCIMHGYLPFDSFRGCKHHLCLCIIHCTCHDSVDTCHSDKHRPHANKLVKNMPAMTTFHRP